MTHTLKSQKIRRRKAPTGPSPVIDGFYEVTDLCGPRLAGRRVVAGDIVALDASEAAFALAQGAVRAVVDVSKVQPS